MLPKPHIPKSQAIHQASLKTVANIRIRLLAELQTAWHTFGRLDLVTKLAAKREAIGKLRDRLSDLMNDLEGIR